MDNFELLLKEHGLQVTTQRLEVLKALKKLNTHVKIEGIKKQLDIQGSYLTLATVYNIINKFVDKGLVRKLKISNEATVYDPNLHYHMHLYDKKKDKVCDFNNLKLNELIMNFLNENSIDNFNVNYVDVVIDGEFTNE